MLQSSRETCASCRNRLQNSQRATNRWNNQNANHDEVYSVIVFAHALPKIHQLLNCLLPVLNCVRLLTRILPYIFEDPDWRGFFWSTLPGQAAEDASQVFTIYNNVCSLSFGCPWTEVPSSTNLCTKVLCFAISPDRFACKSHPRGLTLNIFIRSLPVFVCLI